MEENLVGHPFKKNTKKSHDSAQYDTAWNLTLRSIIVLQITGKIYKQQILRVDLDSALYHTVRNSGKIRISQQKLNQKQNHFNPLVSGPGRFE